MTTFVSSIRDEKLCRECGFCQNVVVCPATDGCVGCLACYRGCPYQARRLTVDESERKKVTIKIDGTPIQVYERITVKRALESIGMAFSKYPGDGRIFAPCEVGGCYSCSVIINGEIRRSCIIPVHEGMEIQTTLPEAYTPLRIIHGPEAHKVGGKATPWWLKGNHYVEVAIWTAGCCYACPQCQNYHVTYDGRSKPLSPENSAKLVTLYRRRYGVNRMAISGGEPTLNRKWLIQFFKKLGRLNPDKEARLHLDSNGAILTKEYLDELVFDVGVTDIGIEPKGVRLETFMRITAIEDEALAEKYLTTSWEAVKYIVDNYRDRIFLGVGLPYNKVLMTLDEVREFGSIVASMDPSVQLCVLDYFPTFRRLDIQRPTVGEMLRVKRILEETGLRTVVVQTSIGRIGPTRPKNRP